MKVDEIQFISSLMPNQDIWLGISEYNENLTSIYDNDQQFDYSKAEIVKKTDIRDTYPVMTVNNGQWSLIDPYQENVNAVCELGTFFIIANF